MAHIKIWIVLLLVHIYLSCCLGTSPMRPLPPSPTCESGEELCGRYNCYSPATHLCLKYYDGSGGTVCPVGDTFCGGKCLSPSSGKVCVQKPGERAGGAGETICDPGQELCGLGYCYSPDTKDCIDGNWICEKGESHCGRECYLPSEAVDCITGQTGWSFVCQRGEKVCGSSGCYDPLEKTCNENQHRLSNI